MCRGTRLTPRRNPAVSWKRLGGEIVTLNRKTHQYHVLNDAAALIFEEAMTGEDLNAIAGKVATEYGVPLAKAEKDVAETLKGFEKLGLLLPPAKKKAAYEGPKVREITEADFNQSMGSGTVVVCRSLLG